MAQSAGKLALVDNWRPADRAGGCPARPTSRTSSATAAPPTAGKEQAPRRLPGRSTTTALFRRRRHHRYQRQQNRLRHRRPDPTTTTPIVQSCRRRCSRTDPTTNGIGHSARRDHRGDVHRSGRRVDPRGSISPAPRPARTTRDRRPATATTTRSRRTRTSWRASSARSRCSRIRSDQDPTTPDRTRMSPPARTTSGHSRSPSGAAPPETPDVHLLMGNPTGAAADISQPNNYLMSKPEYALSYNRDLGRPELGQLAPDRRVDSGNHPSARRYVPAGSGGAARLVSRPVLRLLQQRLRSRAHDPQRRP